MFDFSGSTRLWITAGVLLGASLILHTVSHGESIIPHQPLRELPYLIANWSGQERPLQNQVVQAVGVSDYTSRIYLSPSELPVDLYVGYYANQRTGDTIHSPKNCLPGSGWDPIKSDYLTISIPARPTIVVNEYMIQKDQNKELVLYWYQSRGRVIASEYSGKFWMMVDAISRNRTDGSLVREVTPMNDGEANARARLIKFTQAIYPKIDSIIPK
jgi:EpsI family protein